MKSLSSFVFGWTVLIFVIVFSVASTALNPNFYTSRYEKMGLADSLKVSEADLNKSISTLLDYVKDDRDNIEGSIVRNHISQKTFNEKEKQHMVDVKKLYQNVIRAGWSFLGLGLLIGFYFLVKERKKCLSYLSKGFLQASICFIVFLCFFGFWVFYDFTGFWNWFHTIFFDNDLWLLNPQTDFMICMLPETIFNQLVLSISMKAISIFAIIGIVSFMYQLKRAPIGFDKK